MKPLMQNAFENGQVLSASDDRVPTGFAQLFPPATAPLLRTSLEQLYEYPSDLERAWVQVNFVSSADGAATVNGDSECLSSPADRRVLALARDLADVVLVGAGTAVAGQYHRIRVDPARRAKLGLAPTPPVAIVSNRCSLGPDSPEISAQPVPPMVVTCRNSPAAAQRDLVSAGVDLVRVGEDAVDLRGALSALAERGLRRIDCEGGPQLFGSLAEADLVDALCLTVAPLIAGGVDGRIAAGRPGTVPRSLTLDSVLEAEGSLFVKYRRASPVVSPSG